jgi:general stress protein 26
MKKEELKKQVLTFLQNKFLAVLATVDSVHLPHAATIYYVIDDDFTIYFITKNDTEKYEHLLHNPHVALVVGTENIPRTAQIEGVAEVVHDLQMVPNLLERLSRVSNKGQYPPPAFGSPSGSMSIFKVTVSKIKWLDMTGEIPLHVREEIIFDDVQ